MFKPARLKAEEQFTATQKKDKQALKAKEQARLEIKEHVAKLRSLALQFSGTYFTGDDLKHIQSDHGGDHR